MKQLFSVLIYLRVLFFQYSTRVSLLFSIKEKNQIVKSGESNSCLFKNKKQFELNKYKLSIFLFISE